MPDYIFTNVNTIEDEHPESPPILLIETDNLNSSRLEASSLLEIIQSKTTDLSLVDENYLNQRRLLKLKGQFTPRLLSLILDSDFEYGIESEVDVFVRNQMKENSLATKSWLNDIFVENFSNPVILVGILRIVSRLPYYEIFPEGQMMATTALAHSDIEVMECGVRAFENWNNLHSLKILENLQVAPSWLQEYINTVVEYLRKEHHVPAN